MCRFRTRSKEVSILVVLDCGSRQCVLNTFHDFSTLFQSLLYWIVGRDNCGGDRRIPRNDRFNPCCIGLWVATVARLSRTVAHVLFQSLLYWIVGRDNFQRSFFAGHGGFQSLLYWIVGRDRKRGKELTVHREFQSLLYWIVGRDGFQHRAADSACRFQSLLYWIVGRDENEMCVEETNDDVSILVVLDCVSRPPFQNCADSYSSGFNPCCIGLWVATIVILRLHPFG